jgi:DNA-binding response OmpR family regulator
MVPMIVNKNEGFMYPIMNQQRTILLVENKTVTKSPLLDLLCQQGYAVLTAHSSWQALEALSQTTVDLLIIDSEIGDMKGVDFLHRLRQSNSYAQLPVLMLLEQEFVPVTAVC